MPSRGWLSDTAVTGFIVGAVFTVAAVAVGFVSGEAYQAAHQTRPAEQAEAAHDARQPAAPVEAQKPSPTEPRDLCSGPDSDPNDDLCQQWRMANAARHQIELLSNQNALLTTQNHLVRGELGLVGITLLLAVFGTIFAWKAIEANRQAVRAYVHLSHKGPGLSFSPGNVSVVLKAINAGQTPATVDDARLMLGLFPPKADIPSLLSETRLRKVLTTSVFIVSRGDVEMSIEYPPDRGSGMLVLFGYVDYTDVFGRRYRNGYARVYSPERDDPSIPAHKRNNLIFLDGSTWDYDRRIKSPKPRDDA